MKLKQILILTGIIFLLLSIFFGLWKWQAKRTAAKIATLEANYETLRIAKVQLSTEYATKVIDYGLLKNEKIALEKLLAKERQDTQKKITEYQATIADLLSIPADTVYQILFDKFNTVDGVGGILKFRFAENQIRGMYLNTLERDHFEGLYGSTNKSLQTCFALNIQNDKVIGNLNEQNFNLKQQGLICTQQNSTLQEELKISDKQLGRAKRVGWVAKGAAILGWVAFVFK